MNHIKVIDLEFLQQKEVIAAFLIETSAGPCLVETGPYSTIGQLKDGIQKHGYQPEDIQHVFLSHIHLDHAGAAWWFAKQGATIYVHPKGYKHMNDPSKLMDSATRIYGSMMDTLWGRMEAIPSEQLRSMEDEETITVGDTQFEAWYTPGHAVHHIAWKLGKTLFSGDVGGVKINGGPVVPPCPPPDINVEDWKASISKILQLDLDEMYLTHYGKVDSVASHLEDLSNRLDSWANWIHPHFKNDTPQQNIIMPFQEMVQAELIENGVTDPIHLGQYEAANPSSMSVAGLMRYWEKRNS